MSTAITAVLMSIDQICGKIANALQASEPKIYGSILLIVLVWFMVFPPKDDPGEI